jgi:hypothetical protein
MFLWFFLFFSLNEGKQTPLGSLLLVLLGVEVFTALESFEAFKLESSYYSVMAKKVCFLPSIKMLTPPLIYLKKMRISSIRSWQKTWVFCLPIEESHVN